MREVAGPATAFSEMPASECFSAEADSTICSRKMASEHSMQASMNRPPSATTRMIRRRDDGSRSSLGKKLVMPSISIVKMPAATSISTTTSAAIVETGNPPMRLPEGTSSDIGRAMRLKFTNAPPIATPSTRSEATKSCVDCQPCARTALSSPLRICSYVVMCASMRLVVSSAAPTDLPASEAYCLSSFTIGAMPPRILCRLAVASRYSWRAFFSPDLAVLWISSSTFFTTLSPVAGIFATAAVASAQPGGVGAALPQSL